MGRINEKRIIDSHMVEELMARSNYLDQKYLIDILPRMHAGYERTIMNKWLKYWRDIGTPYIVVDKKYKDNKHLTVYKLRKATDCKCDIASLKKGKQCKCPVFTPLVVTN